MPTEDGLRADQEGGPGWSRQPTAERCWEQPITGLPSWTPGLALEDANLMAEKKYLRLQAGLGVAADEEDIEEQAEEAVDKGQEHDPASSQARPLAQIGLAIGVLVPHTLVFLVRSRTVAKVDSMALVSGMK
jgi:hypothetical protein